MPLAFLFSGMIAPVLLMLSPVAVMVAQGHGPAQGRKADATRHAPCPHYRPWLM